MPDFRIRKMELKDKNALMEILHLADPHGEGHPAPELVYRRWGEYYFEESRDHCFVAAHRATDRAAGVILCAPDTPGYQKIFNKHYYREIQKTLDQVENSHPGTIRKHHMAYYRKREGVQLNLVHFRSMRHIYREYPAHLHINIHPDCQRLGLGHLLVDALLNPLKETGIKGLHLIVASDNSKGIGFYRKYGFKELLNIFPRGKNGIIYGLKTS
ncbi:MAG: GNAT family N-acetyltransferase [Spirochaetales bacterium]|nr:GNAT family N-acetyltransferase [Spirochaetales bacterium]